MQEQDKQDGIAINLNLLGIRPGEKFMLELPGHKVEITCVRHAWFDAALALADENVMNGAVLLAAWLAFFGKQLSETNAPHSMVDCYEKARIVITGSFCKALQACKKEIPPDISLWQQYVAVMDNIDSQTVNKCHNLLDTLALTYGPFNNTSNPTNNPTSLLVFRRLAEGVFENIDYDAFLAGEIEVASIGPEREILLAILGIEVVDSTSNVVNVEPLLFSRYIVSETGRFDINDCFTSVERTWEPTKLDFLGLQALLTGAEKPAGC